jgi:hypothetical protein
LKKRIEEIENWRSQRLKKSKFEEVEDWRSQRLKKSKIEDLKFGDSTRVCDSSRVSGATDMDMPFGYPRISIPGPTHYGGEQVKGLEDDLETKKKCSNPYWIRTLVKL